MKLKNVIAGMKRTMLVLLTIVLISGCGKTKVESQPEVSTKADSEENIETVKKSESENNTEKNTKATVEKSETKTSKRKIKYTVSADWSNYESSKPYVNDDKYSRLKEEYIGLYEASTSNGYVYPFLMSERSSSAIFGGGDYFNTDMTGYGFVDETGKIVSDYGYSYISKHDGGFYRASKDSDEIVNYYKPYYYVSFDGKISFVHYEDLYRQYSDTRLYRIGDTYSFVTSEVTPMAGDEGWLRADRATEKLHITTYDKEGNVLVDRDINFDRSITEAQMPYQYFGNLTAIPEELLDNKYLLIETTRLPNYYIVQNVIDLDTDAVILRGFDKIKMCKNHTFIVTKDERSYLCDCLGNRINSASFAKLYYLDNDYYITSEDDKELSLVKLESGMFIEQKKFYASNYVAEDGLLIIIDENENATFYNYDGSLLDQSQNEKVALITKAIKCGALRTSQEFHDTYKGYGLELYIDDEKENYIDGLSDSYYIYEAEGKKWLTRFKDDNKVMLTGKNAKISVLMNGKIMIDNALYDLETGNMIFKYTPYRWDNLD